MDIHLLRKAKDWDSCLMPTDDNTLELLFQFRVNLVRVEPETIFNIHWARGTGDGIAHAFGKNYHLDMWTDMEWESYKTDFVNIVQRHWNEKFILDANKSWYRPRAGNALNSANITCSLSIQLVDTSAQAHQTYYIIHPTSTSFRSFVLKQKNTGIFTHLDLEPTWNTRKTKIGHVKHSVSFLQTTISHEFGHTLGLNHVNGVGNDDYFYGVTLQQRDNQMGMGGFMTASHARPWINRLKSHLINQNHFDTTVHFKGRVASMQLIDYWDNDWQPPATKT